MTTNMEELQALFFKWFKFYEKRNLNQIRVATKNLLTSYEYETKSSLFKIFYPLVRYGLIEFCGDGTYTPSSPILLFYPDNKAVGINLNSVQIEKLKNRSQSYTIDRFGIVRFTATENELVTFSNKIDINSSKPNTAEYLSNFPKIKNIITDFDKVYSSDLFKK